MALDAKPKAAPKVTVKTSAKPGGGKPTAGKPASTPRPANGPKPLIIKDGQAVANPAYKPAARPGGTPAAAPKLKLPRPALQPTPLSR